MNSSRTIASSATAVGRSRTIHGVAGLIPRIGGGHRTFCPSYWADPCWRRFGWEPTGSGCTCRPAAVADPVETLVLELSKLLSQQAVIDLANVLPYRLAHVALRGCTPEQSWMRLFEMGLVDRSAAAA